MSLLLRHEKILYIQNWWIIPLKLLNGNRDKTGINDNYSLKLNILAACDWVMTLTSMYYALKHIVLLQPRKNKYRDLESH